MLAILAEFFEIGAELDGILEFIQDLFLRSLQKSYLLFHTVFESDFAPFKLSVIDLPIPFGELLQGVLRCVNQRDGAVKVAENNEIRLKSPPMIRE